MLEKIAISSSSNNLDYLQSLAYSSPILPIYFLLGPVYILQGMYAKYFGLSLSTIAIVILVSRIFDAVTDPIIGYFSDMYFSRYGSRKPFVVVGGILFVVSSWFLYVPPSNVSALYFLFSFLAFYFSYTLFVVPHYAWGGELVVDCQQRSRIYSFRTFGLFLGMLLFFGVPLLPLFETSQFTPDTLEWAVFFAGLWLMCFDGIKSLKA